MNACETPRGYAHSRAASAPAGRPVGPSARRRIAWAVVFFLMQWGETARQLIVAMLGWLFEPPHTSRPLGPVSDPGPVYWAQTALVSPTLLSEALTRWKKHLESQNTVVETMRAALSNEFQTVFSDKFKVSEMISYTDRPMLLLFLERKEEQGGQPNLWVAKVTPPMQHDPNGNEEFQVLELLENNLFPQMARTFIARTIGTKLCKLSGPALEDDSITAALEKSGLNTEVRVLLLEGVRGKSLGAVLRSNKLKPMEIAVLLAQGVFAIAAFQRAGLAHNDLHLWNVLVVEHDLPLAAELEWSEYGKVTLPASKFSLKIIDFDLASVRDNYPARYGKDACHKLGVCGQDGRDVAQFLYNVQAELRGKLEYRQVSHLAKFVANNDVWMNSNAAHHAHAGHPCWKVEDGPCNKVNVRSTLEALQILWSLIPRWASGQVLPPRTNLYTSFPMNADVNVDAQHVRSSLSSETAPVAQTDAAGRVWGRNRSLSSPRSPLPATLVQGEVRSSADLSHKLKPWRTHHT